MRILHVSAYFAPAFAYGGPPRSILQLCQGLQRAGATVEVVTTTANGAADRAPSPPGGEVFEGVPVRYLARTAPRHLFAADGLAEALARSLTRADLVHLHGLWNLPVWTAARLARRAGMPYVISPRGMLDPGSLAYHAVRKRIAYRLIEHRNLASAARVHVTSAAERDAVAGLGVRAPITVVPNAVDLPPSDISRGAARARLAIGPDRPLVVFLGRLHPIKRLDILAEAFVLLRRTRPDAHLAIAGPDERDMRPAIEPRLAAARDHVHWLGQVDERQKWELLADASALVSCSDSESFGLSVAEALAAGTPVVVTETVPWREAEEAGAGFCVGQRPDAVADALARFLGDPGAIAEMGRRGRALIDARYGAGAIGRVMAAQYESLLLPVALR